MLRGAVLSSICMLLPGPGGEQPGAQQAGRGLLSSLDASSLPAREALPGSACQLSVLRSAGRKVFPTASADRTSTELSKGDLAEMPTSQLQ